MGRKIKVSSAGQIVELQEDRKLFARMMVICKSRPDIDINLKKLLEPTNSPRFRDLCLLLTEK